MAATTPRHVGVRPAGERRERRPGRSRAPRHIGSRRAVAPGSMVIIVVIALFTGACASHSRLPGRPSPESLPAGSPLRSRTLPEADAWLRHYLMFQQWPEASAAFTKGSPLAPSDRLLRALQEAVMLHEAGEYAASNEALAWAAEEADDRYTRSLSRELGSILVNDRVLAYTPTAGELAMIPYYRMLNHLALGDLEGALVESRRANALLFRMKDEPLRRCNEEALLQYLAGLVQASGGEVNDALVSLRLAEQGIAGCPGGGGTAGMAIATDLARMAARAGMSELADSVALRYGVEDRAPDGGTGEVLVVVEHGFIAHRTQDALHVPVPTGDLDHLDSDDEDGIARVVGRISTALMLDLGEADVWGRPRRAYGGSRWAYALDDAYVLRIAWPSYRLEADRPRSVRVAVGQSLIPTASVSDLSTVMREELEDERPAMLTRLVLRGITRYLLTREIEEAAEKKHGETAGFIIGRLTNLAANQLEQADTRSWSLLPDRISLLRMNLPAGDHNLWLEVEGDDGQVSRRDLGTIRVTPGRLTVVSERVWGEAGV